MYRFRLYFLFFVLLLLTGCVEKTEKPIAIATNEWIGYTPLFLAASEHKLQPLGFKLITSVSLAQASEIFTVGKADVVTTTQHECNLLKQHTDVKPFSLLDISNGGDMILANRTVPELSTSGTVTVYLEKDSINSELFTQFIENNHLPRDHFRLIDRDQSAISAISYDKNIPVLIVTYAPYNYALTRKGFFEIASTRVMTQLIVVDALCTRTNRYEENKPKFVALKRLIDANIERIKKEPESVYEQVKSYLGNLSYQEFKEALSLIKWVNKPSENTLDSIEEIGYKRSDILP
jgi:NitT/TauT family transport system substrate-binding protein